MRSRKLLFRGGKPRQWNRRRVVVEIQALKYLHSTWVKLNNNALWKAGVRYFDSWGEAVEAAGYDYDQVRKAGPTGPPPNKGSGGSCDGLIRSGCTEPHHAKGKCKRCYAILLRQDKLRTAASDSGKAAG